MVYNILGNGNYILANVLSQIKLYMYSCLFLQEVLEICLVTLSEHRVKKLVLDCTHYEFNSNTKTSFFHSVF
jgi:glutamate racemase